MKRSATLALWAVVFLLVLAGCNTGENAKDSDGDGLADAAERFFTGTDPADPDFCFARGAGGCGNGSRG